MNEARLHEPVIGFRSWALVDGILTSPYRHDKWLVATKEASCPLVDHASGSPAPGCRCGIYAWYEPQAFPASGLVSGVVSLWGRIEAHATGMRAQFARVEVLTQAVDGLDVVLAKPDALAAIGREFGSPLPMSLRPALPSGTTPTERDQLVQAHLSLVVSIAKHYRGEGLSFLDLIRAGTTGLTRAAEKFDSTRGYLFGTYATWWVRQAIAHALSERRRIVRIPVHLVEDMNRLARFERSFAAEFGSEPSAEECASGLGISLERVIEVRRYGHG